MKCDKGMQCDWCEYRDFIPVEAGKEIEDTCSPPDGKCPMGKEVFDGKN